LVYHNWSSSSNSNQFVSDFGGVFSISNIRIIPINIKNITNAKTNRIINTNYSFLGKEKAHVLGPSLSRLDLSVVTKLECVILIAVVHEEASTVG
jgi:hypothetical protein